MDNETVKCTRIGVVGFAFGANRRTGEFSSSAAAKCTVAVERNGARVRYGLFGTVYEVASHGTRGRSTLAWPIRCRSCVKHYAGKQKPLEMQMFARCAIKALVKWKRRTRSVVGSALFLSENTAHRSGMLRRAIFQELRFGTDTVGEVKLRNDVLIKGCTTCLCTPTIIWKIKFYSQHKRIVLPLSGLIWQITMKHQKLNQHYLIHSDS